MRRRAGALRAALAAAALVVAAGRIHHLTIEDDGRTAFLIESFGFLPGGRVSLDVTSLSVSGGAPPHMGLFVFGSDTASAAGQIVSKLASTGECTELGDARFLALNLTVKPPPMNWATGIHSGGFFNLMFMRCLPPAMDSALKVSFHLDYVFVNPGPNYLSAGEIPLPGMLGGMAVLFGIVAIIWLSLVRSRRADVHKVHHLMTLLVVAKVLSVIFEAVMYHFIALTGHSTGWNIAFYIATFARGCVLIVVIALIGAGWSLLKPALSANEKKVIMVIIPIQVLNNVAIIVVDEMNPGTTSFSAWILVLHVADIAACAAVLLPVLWSLQSLRASCETDRGDDKLADTIARLVQFRSFYLLTIAYLYITRILVYLLLAVLPYNMQWFAPMVEEVVTLGYYITVGARFRPGAATSEYLRVPSDDVGDVEMARTAETAALDNVATALGGGEGASGSGRVPVPLEANGSDAVDAKTSSASVRAVAPIQTISKGGGASNGGETAAGSSITNGGRPSAAKIAIADDDRDGGAERARAKGRARGAAATKATADGGGIEDDDFGVDEDEDDDDFDMQVGLRRADTTVTAASGGGGTSSGVKHVWRDM